MPSPEGLQVANKFTIAMPSVAQPGRNTQPFERDNSLACKRCQAGQILREGRLQLVRVTQTEQAPECWHSFQDSVGWAGGDSHVPKTCQNRKGFAAGFVSAGFPTAAPPDKCSRTGCPTISLIALQIGSRCSGKSIRRIDIAESFENTNRISDSPPN